MGILRSVEGEETALDFCHEAQTLFHGRSHSIMQSLSLSAWASELVIPENEEYFCWNSSSRGPPSSFHASFFFLSSTHMRSFHLYKYLCLFPYLLCAFDS